MHEMNINEVKQSELDVLCMLDAVCKKYNLTYFLFAGTLLGAVRHKGFIPWDDDIDVAMPRKDYNILIELSKTVDLGFNLLCFEQTEGYTYPFGKACDKNTVLVENNRPNCEMGVYVDIFPLDVLPDDRNKAYKYANRFCYYFWLIYMSGNDKYERGSSAASDFAKRFLFPVSKMIGANRLNKKAVKDAQIYNNTNSRYISIILSALKKPVLFESSWFDETVKLPFEGMEFNAPAKYKEVLHAHFGDFMKLPPIEQQVAHHNFIAYRK